MFGFLRKRLGYKIMAAIIISVSLVVVIEIIERIHFGTIDRLKMASTFSEELATSTYAGITYPMSIGDSEAIKRQLSDIRKKMTDIEVFICDFDQEIIYSTHENKVKTTIAESVFNKDALQSLSEVLKTGTEPPKPFEDTVSGKRQLVTIQPIPNQKDCYHCHGSSRKVLGAIVVKMDIEQVYASVVAARNITIILGMLGVCAITFLIYIMLTKLVSRPVESLAEKAKRFAEGDMSVSVDVKTEDEIGVLSNTFNYMVKQLKMEATRKTTLLDERAQLIILLEKANRELRELDKLKSTFIANMSHELRTPMNAIIGYTELLMDMVDGPINKEQKKSLKKVEANARHLLQLINDVLDISKVESGKIKLETKEHNLKQLIESVIPTFEPMIKQKGLKLTTTIDDNLPPIYGDDDRIRQILIILLSNAVKFTNKGGITITAKLSERGIKPGESPIFAEICIEDTGIGIKEEDLSKIFNRFVQADLSTTRQYEGTGLGLSIARGLVALHKGVIWATSNYGEGSKFCFTTPLKKEMLEKPAEPVTEPAMAEALAKYFGRSVETFLKDPEYAGKPIRCWEYIKCGQPSCPAYRSKENRCWLILGTHCTGMKIAAYPEKVDFCKGCELIESLILKPEEEYRPAEPESPKEKH